MTSGKRPKTVYWMWALGALGVAVTALATVLEPPSLHPEMVAPVLIIAAAAFFSGIYQIRLTSENVVSICVAAFAAGVFAFGPIIGAWLAAVVDFFITIVDNRRVKQGLAAPPPPDAAPGRLPFNTGLNAAMFLAGGYAYRLVAGNAPLRSVDVTTIVGVLAFFVALQLVNTLFMGLLCFVREPRPLRHLLRDSIKWALFDLPLIPAAVVLALFYAQGMLWGLAFAAASLVFASSLLQRENRLDLVVKRYVSSAKSSKILANPYELLRAERRNISIIFADLRGTTGISQRLPPTEMLTLLNDFHHAMIEEVVKAGATVDKILGDGLMILVGAPVRQEDHAAKAVRLAVTMQRRYKGVQAELERRGLPAPGMGIGVSTGEVVIGNVGSELRLDYTAIGGEVNVASKLCTAAAAGEILLSDGCARRVEETVASGRAPYLAEVTFEGRPPLEVAGLSEPLSPVEVTYG